MSKLGSLLIVVGLMGVASASPCDWDAGPHWGVSRSDRPASAYELGFVWERFDVDALTHPVFAKVIRFDTRAWFGRHMYVGGEAEWGSLTADTDAPENVLARSDTMTQPVSVTGNLGAAHVVVGTSATTGVFSGGAELATGLRYTNYTASASAPGGMLDTSFVLEGRGRLDLRLTRVLSIGAVAGVDLRDAHAVSLGLVAGLRFPR